jgi:hypothetical protein
LKTVFSDDVGRARDLGDGHRVEPALAEQRIAAAAMSSRV